MYENARNRVRVSCNLSEEFSVKVGLHQGSCLSPLLFIMLLETLSQEFRTGCPRENLYADDMVIITESLEELQEKLIHWKTNLEGKGLWVNFGKTKVLISRLGLDVLQKPNKGPCAMCLKGVGTNSIFCGNCSCWVHKGCSGSFGTLKPDPSLRCQRCTGQARPVDGRPMIEVTVGRETLEVVPTFCHRWDCLTSGGGCELDYITSCSVAYIWRKCNELLPILTPTHFPSPPEKEFTIHAPGVPCSMQAKPGLQPYLITRNSMTIYWLCGATAKGQVSSQDLLLRMQLDDLTKVLCTRRLRWHGHVKRSDGSLKKVQKLPLEVGAVAALRKPV